MMISISDSENILEVILNYISENEEVTEELAESVDLSKDDLLNWVERVKVKVASDVNL